MVDSNQCIFMLFILKSFNIDVEKRVVCGEAVKGKGGRPNTGYEARFSSFFGMLQLIQNTIHNVTQPDRSGPGYSKPTNTDPGLKVERGLNFFCVKVFNVPIYCGN